MELLCLKLSLTIHLYLSSPSLPNIMRMMCQINISIDSSIYYFDCNTSAAYQTTSGNRHFCRFCCVSFSLEAPSPIPAASPFWACHHIYFVSHLCVAFWLSSYYSYSSLYASTIHVTVYTCEASFLCLSKYGASIQFSASQLLLFFLFFFTLMHTKFSRPWVLYAPCVLVNVPLFFSLIL